MLLIGKKITVPGDVLTESDVERVYKAITNPSGEVALLQQKLRQLKMIDMNQYRKMKTTLPYMVCAKFHPKVRKKENFLYTERFLIDIDHLSEFELDINTVKNELKKDTRVELLFASPGGDGLKVLFVLKDKITDSSYYSLFYKTFCQQFATQYRLGAAVDTKTNDVSRCCFVSFDAESYYNKNAERIYAAGYLSPDGFADLDKINREIKEHEKEDREQVKESGIATDSKAEALTDDILAQIKIKVGQRVKAPVAKYYEQPEELPAIMKEVEEQLSGIGLAIDKSIPISYGRQIKVVAGKHWAEVNIFYGTKGVSIVGSTRSGSNRELCGSLTSLLISHFK